MSNILYSPLPVYRHSGRVPPAAGALGLLAAVGFGLVGGAAYGTLGFLGQLIPVAKLSFVAEILLVLGFCWCLGGIPTSILKRLKARSVPSAVAAALLASFLGLYVGWVAWIYSYFTYGGRGDVSILALARPDVLLRIIGHMVEKGVWTLIDDVQPKGIFLAAIWASEAGILVIAPAVMARRMMLRDVFCDACDRWGTRRDLMQLREAPAGTFVPHAFHAELMQGNFEGLASMAPRRDTDLTWYDVFLEGCPECGTRQTLNVTRSAMTLDKQGKSTIKTKDVVRRLLLSPEQTIALAQIAANHAEPDHPAADEAAAPDKATDNVPADAPGEVTPIAAPLADGAPSPTAKAPS